MRLLKRKCWRVLAFIVFALFMLGCSPSPKVEKPSITEDIKLNLGAVLKSEDGNYKLYNYVNGKYQVVKENNTVLVYDKDTSSYVYSQGEKHYVVHDGHKNEIKDLNFSNIKISKGGEFISYFIEDNGLKLKVFNAATNDEIKMKSDVSISGTLYDWYDSNTIIYYGVSNDGVNGLFTYNLKENKEELLYNIKEGYLAFLKGTDDDVLFIQITLQNNKELMMINKETKACKVLSDSVEELSDIIMNNGKIYFTGKVYGNVNSLYEIKENKPKRLVFDFPAIVKTEKGLKTDENNNVLFVGCNNINSDVEQIYTYSQDGSISSVSKDSTDYVFVNNI